MEYTIAITENRTGGSAFYVDADLNVQKSKASCKPLTRENANKAAQIVRRQAKKLRRPVKVSIVPMTSALA